MRGRALLAGALLPILLAIAPAAQAGCSALLRSDQHADALPLRQMGHSAWTDVAPRAGRNLAYLDDEARLQCDALGWRWALLARSHALAAADGPALALAAQVGGGRSTGADAAWPVHARWRGFSGAGLALGRGWVPAEAWTLQAETQLLSLSQWRERRIDGAVQYRAAGGQYGIDLRSQEASSRLSFPFEHAHAARGWGALLALQAGWQSRQLWAQAGLRDAGWLHWRGLPQQEAVLSTSTQGVDEDGFLIYRPLIQGQNTQAGLQRSVAPVATAAAGWQGADGRRIGLALERRPGFGVLPILQWQQAAALSGGLAWRAEWRLHERRAGLQLDWQAWTIEAAADRLDRQARSRAIGLAWRTPI